MPGNTVYVGRPSKWGNLARGDQFQAAASYVLRLQDNPDMVERARMELEGKNLACWCSHDSPCHGNVLLLVANGITLETISTDLKLLWETRFWRK